MRLFTDTTLEAENRYLDLLASTSPYVEADTDNNEPRGLWPFLLSLLPKPIQE